MESSVECRKENGQFKQGFSGNPGGRPKDEYKVAKRLIQVYCFNLKQNNEYAFMGD